MVSIDLTFARLVDLGRWFVTRQNNLLLDASVFDALHVKNEAHQAFQGADWTEADVLVSDNVHRDFSFEPKVVEVAPNSNFLLNELFPVAAELLKVSVGDGKIMRPGANHIEQACYAVER